jgi:hypothetical protein
MKSGMTRTWFKGVIDMTVSGLTSSGLTTLFSSLSSSSSSSASSGLFSFNVSDYNMIRSGSYFKLLKSYYASDSSNAKSTQEDFSNSYTTSTSKETSTTLANIESTTDDLNESAEALYKTNASAFKKVSSGSGTCDYDTDAIYNAVSSFVDDYNSVIKAAGKSSASGITSAAESLANVTAQNADALSELGISIDSEKSTLSIDKETFRSADMSKAKTLFNGTGSYAYNVATKSSLLNYQAEREASKSSTYSSTGTYSTNYISGTIYNSYS